MVKNIRDQRIDGIIVAQNSFHLTKGSFALFNNLWISIMSHDFILCINQAQRSFIQIKFDNSAFIINRAGCAIFNSLSHIIDVNIITEHFTSAAVFRRNRSSSKSDVCSIRQAVTNDTGSTNYTLCNFFAFIVLGHFNSFSQTILTTMSFVSHYYDISTLRKGFMGLLKLLHSRKDNTVCLTTGKQITQIFSALSVHWVLAQEIFTLCKLPEQLIVQVVSVSQHNDSRTVQCFLKQMGIEYHRQGLAAALCMPEHATFTIGNGSSLGRLNCFSYGKILMIASQNLKGIHALVREADKILYQVKQTLFLEHTLKESIKLSVLRIFIAAIDGFPFHEAIFTRSNRTGFRSHLVTHNADGIVNEHGRDLLHVVTKLTVCVRSIRFFSGRRFQFNNHNRNTIQEKENIRALVAVFNESPLVRYDKGVVIGVLVINEIDDGGAFLALLKITHRNTVLEIIHKYGILLYKLTVLKVLQLKKRIRNSVLRQRTVQTVK